MPLVRMSVTSASRWTLPVDLQQDWENLKSHIERSVEPRLRLEIAKMLDDFDLLLDSGVTLPLQVETEHGWARLGRTEAGTLEMVVHHVGHHVTRFLGGVYRHTTPTGRRAQTRSVYLDDETWTQVCALGRPADVIRDALRAYLDRSAPSAPPERRRRR